MTAALTAVRKERRRVLAHQCGSCRRLWALRLVQDEHGPAVRCCYCGAPRAVSVPQQAGASRRR